MRLFIALAPPALAVADLDATLAPLRGLHTELRWTSTEAWHVTLAFLGEVAEERLARLLPRMERAARRHPAFRLSLRRAGAFPSAARANVLWSGLAATGGHWQNWPPRSPPAPAGPGRHHPTPRAATTRT